MSERKDIWKPEDDQVLSETILNHIREGSTQLHAFEEAARRLDRTPAACGFRWNAEVRKRHEEEIKAAKMQKARIPAPLPTHSASRMESGDGNSVIRAMLGQVKHIETTTRQLQESIQQLQSLLREKDDKMEQMIQAKPDKVKWTEDYQSLLEILNRARQLGVFDQLSGKKANHTG